MTSRIGVRRGHNGRGFFPRLHISVFNKPRGGLLACTWTCANSGLANGTARLKLYKNAGSAVAPVLTILVTGPDATVPANSNVLLSAIWTIPNDYPFGDYRIWARMETDSSVEIAHHEQLITISALAASGDPTFA